MRILPGPLLALLLLAGQGAAVLAQVSISDPSLVGQPIDAIEISGNKVTRDAIILREMKTRVGATANRRRLEADLLRVKALNLFTHVEFALSRQAGRSVLSITVTEEWYIFPLPYWNFKDNDPDKLIYGFRYRQNNFRGRNETLIVSLWTGADRGFQFSHHNPWVRGTPQLSRAIDLSQYTRVSQRLALRDLDLEERHTSAELRVGRRWTIESLSEIGLRFRLVQADNPLQLASGGQLDRILELKFSSYWDQRDLRTFPREGFYLQGDFIQGWVLNDGGDYQRLALDARGYVPLRPRLSGALRLVWQPGWGNVPPYDWIVVSGTSPIRSANLEDEGKSLYRGSLEARYDLMPLRYFTWKKAPVFKPYFRNLEYGLSAELFVDAGDAYSPGFAPTWSALQWGYGTGLLLLLPYVDVVRLEMSFNPEYGLAAAQFSTKVEISF